MDFYKRKFCMHLLLWLVWATSLGWLVKAFADDREIVASTIYGKVRGTTRSALSSKRVIFSFFGIPYGRSPDYAFRFLPAENPWPWKGVRDTTNENAPFCQQDKKVFSNFLKDTWFRFATNENHPMKEDCLTVNVFSPTHPSKALEAKALPVIVWIHGGSLQKSSTSNKMWMMPAFENVVLVSIQYRLGIFGFYTLDDDVAPGNMGLLDQVKALEWIRDNIRNFGGDPGSVTVTGGSAGAFCVSVHTLSPLSRGLFHGAVLMSGVASLPPMIQRNQGIKGLEVAKQANCSFWENIYSVTCLRNHVTSSELIKFANEKEVIFYPTVDKKFLPSSIDVLLMERTFNTSVPVMVGGVPGEVDFTLGRLLIPGYHAGVNHYADAAKLIKSDFEAYFPNQKQNVLDSLLKEYLNDSNTEYLSYTRGLSDYFADSWFHSQSVRVANIFKRAGSKVYFYEFATQPSIYKNKKLFPRPHEHSRADHADDTMFFFGFPFLKGIDKSGLKFTKQEKNLSRTMMKMLAEFARKGSPDLSSFEWPQFPSYALINETVAIRQDFRSKQMKIWNSISCSQCHTEICDASTCDCASKLSDDLLH